MDKSLRHHPSNPWDYFEYYGPTIQPRQYPKSEQLESLETAALAPIDGVEWSEGDSGRAICKSCRGNHPKEKVKEVGHLDGCKLAEGLEADGKKVFWNRNLPSKVINMDDYLEDFAKELSAKIAKRGTLKTPQPPRFAISNAVW